jgi:hypothetical protein
MTNSRKRSYCVPKWRYRRAASSVHPLRPSPRRRIAETPMVGSSAPIFEGSIHSEPSLRT